MGQRIRLTESDLHKMIKEAVSEVLNEGQGWNMIKNLWKNREELPDTDQEYDKGFTDDGKREFVDNDRIHIGKEYYDKDGYYTDQEYDKNGMRHKPVNNSKMGKLGRNVAWNVGKGLSKMNIAKNKRQLNKRNKDNGDYASF